MRCGQLPGGGRVRELHELPGGELLRCALSNGGRGVRSWALRPVDRVDQLRKLPSGQVLYCNRGDQLRRVRFGSIFRCGVSRVQRKLPSRLLRGNKRVHQMRCGYVLNVSVGERHAVFRVHRLRGGRLFECWLDGVRPVRHRQAPRGHGRRQLRRVRRGAIQRKHGVIVE